jgi:hypothetical protein
MPSDPYQITVSGDNEISITLSDVGVATPAPHASSHGVGGSDPIPLATNAISGLASAAHITTLESHTTAIADNTSDISDIINTIGGIDNGILSLSVSAPITKTGTSNPTIGLPASSATADGYMTASQFQKLASITTGATANSIAVSSPLTTVSSGGIQTLGVSAATTTLNGYLSSSDKTKLDSVTSGAAISTVSVAAPLVKTGTTAPTISLPAVTTSTDGYMLAADKNKLDSLTASTATTSVLGYMSAADKTKLNGVTAGASITDVTVSSPLVKTGTTAPALSIQAATTSQNGYFSSTDKTKLDSLTTVSPQVTKTFYAGPVSGANANPTFRTIASTDLPTVAIAQGGTGAVTAPLAVNALGFKSGRVTVNSGVATVADSAITTSSIVVATQEFMGTSTGAMGSADDLVIEWCIKDTSGGSVVVATELVEYTGSKYYALDPYNEKALDAALSFFTDAAYSVSATDFIALFRGGDGPPDPVDIGHSFWESEVMLKKRGLWNYDVEAQYDLAYCTRDSGNKIRVLEAYTWGVGRGGTMIIDPIQLGGMKAIIPRNLQMSAWGVDSPKGDSFVVGSSNYNPYFNTVPNEKCYWFDGGFVPSTFVNYFPQFPMNPTLLEYPSTVVPQSIYVNGVETNVMFPRLKIASDVLVTNTPSTLNRISVQKTAGTGFTIYSSNTVDSHTISYIRYNP